MSRLRGIEYYSQLRRAEEENDACTQNTIEGKRLRAGQFWNEEKKIDSRDAARETDK